VGDEPKVSKNHRKSLVINPEPAIASPRTPFPARGESIEWLHPFPVFIDERLFEVTPNRSSTPSAAHPG
jgi:hypothetical protein